MTQFKSFDWRVNFSTFAQRDKSHGTVMNNRGGELADKIGQDNPARTESTIVTLECVNEWVISTPNWFVSQATGTQDYRDTGRYSAWKKTGEQLTLDVRVDAAHGRSELSSAHFSRCHTDVYSIHR